jgi:hypothetical protein
MPFARASELDRLFACAGSAVLQREERPPGEAALWGTACHKWKETGHLPANAGFRRLMEKKIAESGIGRNALWPEEGEHEVALAYNVVTRESRRCTVPIGEDDDRYKGAWKAGFDNQWVTGTLDFAMILMEEPWVDDLKTGRHADPNAYLYQQSFYVLAWAGAVDSRSTITHWPKYPVAGEPVRLGRTFSAGYLADFQVRLAELREDVLRGSPALITGSQCDWCPSKRFCPKFKEEVSP